LSSCFTAFIAHVCQQIKRKDRKSLAFRRDACTAVYTQIGLPLRLNGERLGRLSIICDFNNVGLSENA